MTTPPRLLALHVIFGEERLKPLAQLILRRTWPLESPSSKLIPSPLISKKIAKPHSEVGRPGRNGYSLSVVLGWNREDYQKVQAGVRAEVNNTLERGLPFNKQDPKKLAAICIKLKEQFRILNGYREDWVVFDFIRGCLRNSTRYRPNQIVV